MASLLSLVILFLSGAFTEMPASFSGDRFCGRGNFVSHLKQFFTGDVVFCRGGEKVQPNALYRGERVITHSRGN